MGSKEPGADPGYGQYWRRDFLENTTRLKQQRKLGPLRREVRVASNVFLIRGGGAKPMSSEQVSGPQVMVLLKLRDRTPS